MRKWLIIIGVVVLACVVIGGIRLVVLVRQLPNYVRDRAISTLRARFDCDVQLATFDVSKDGPWVKITGTGLVLRPAGQPDLPPLIQVKTFSAQAGLMQLLNPVKHIRSVWLEGLWIQLPPRGQRLSLTAASSQAGTQTSTQTGTKAARKRPPAPLSVVLDTVTADNAELDLLSSVTGKPPTSFVIHHLTLYEAGRGRPMTFHADLTNPRPPGEIVTSGRFGPWKTEEPRVTPISGSYTFNNADLGVFRGIAGILSSEGKYNGVLDRIVVDAEATIPDFELREAGHSLLLKTKFHSIVDGTNGNTLLQPLHADFLHTALVTTGGVVRAEAVKGRNISLNVVTEHARVEDLTVLASKATTQPLTGPIWLKAKFDLPAGEGDVFDRMKLAGDFKIEHARFSNPEVEQKLGTLSRVGQGQQASEQPDDGKGKVLSDLKGQFTFAGGVATFSNLTFAVPGAWVELKGKYIVRTEAYDFEGTLQLHAKVSELVHGWKSILLKPIDPFFEKGKAGTSLPLTITGTRGKPVFEVQVAKIFKRKAM